MYYNNEMKMRFLESKKGVGTAKMLFEKSKGFESKNDSDLCLLDRGSVVKIIQDISGYKSSNAYSAISTLKTYVRFCQGFESKINRELLGINYADIDLSEGARRFLFESPFGFLNGLNRNFDPPSSLSRDCILRSYLWCAYIGVHYKRIDSVFETKIDSVFLDDKTIFIGGNIYELYDECIDDFSNLVNRRGFELRTEVSNPFLFRGVKIGESHLSPQSISVDVSNRQSIHKIKYRDAYMAGIFYRAYEAEKQGLEPNFNHHMKEISANPNTWVRKARFLKKDYEAWKKAFY